MQGSPLGRALTNAIAYRNTWGCSDVPGEHQRQETMKIGIASDVGGTFTDSIAYDPVAPHCRLEVSTTPQARDVGTVEGLREPCRNWERRAARSAMSATV